MTEVLAAKRALPLFRDAKEDQAVSGSTVQPKEYQQQHQTGLDNEPLDINAKSDAGFVRLRAVARHKVGVLNGAGTIAHSPHLEGRVVPSSQSFTLWRSPHHRVIFACLAPSHPSYVHYLASRNPPQPPAATEPVRQLQQTTHAIR